MPYGKDWGKYKPDGYSGFGSYERVSPAKEKPKSAPDPRDEMIRGLREALINAAANLATVARTDWMYEVQRKQCQAWSDEALAAARKLVRQPYMGQIMAECDCSKRDECQKAGRCIAEVR